MNFCSYSNDVLMFLEKRFNSCVDPFYGPLCAPILEKFPHHRHDTIKNYYTGRNFGSIQIQWGSGDDTNSSEAQMQINVHNVNGDQVLTTGFHPLSYYGSQMTESQLMNIDGVSDGHLIPYVKKTAMMTFVFLFTMRLLLRRALNKTSRRSRREKKMKLK